MAILRRLKAGDPITADLLNELAVRLERAANLAVAPGGDLRLFEAPDGKHLVLASPRPIWAQLSGGTSPYSFTEVQPAAGGTWATLGNRTGSNAYELNNLAGLDGKIVKMTWTTAGDWRFNYPRHGTTACSPGTAQICVVIDDDGCGTPLGTNATITVKDSGGSTVGSCVTTGVVTALQFFGGGSGYTDGTNYDLIISGGGGSGASATFDVVGGGVTNLQLTGGGSGYTSTPTLSFANGGGGTGASATVIIEERCCVPISTSGNYTVTCDVPGAVTLSSTVSAACTLTGNMVHFSFPTNSLGKLCVVCTTCNNSGSFNVSGATISISGPVSETVTTAPDGQVCVKLGVGTGYSATITYPSGFTYTPGSFSIGACFTATITISTVTEQAGTLRMPADPFDGHCGCTGTLSITDSLTGAVLGTCSLPASTTTPSLTCTTMFSLAITETLSTSLVDYAFAYPLTTITATSQPIQCPIPPLAFDASGGSKAC